MKTFEKTRQIIQQEVGLNDVQCLNRFKPVCAQLSDITDSQTRHGHKIIIFFHSLQKLLP